MPPKVMLKLVLLCSNLQAIFCGLDKFKTFRTKTNLWGPKTKEVVTGLSFFQCTAACHRDNNCKVVKYEPNSCIMAKSGNLLQSLNMPVDTYGLPTENVLIKRSLYQTGRLL